MGDRSADNSDVISEALLGAVAKKLGESALKKSRKEAAKMLSQAKRLKRGLGCLGFVGGLLTAGVSFLGMLNLLNPLGFVVEAYTFLFGIGIALIEMQNQCLPLAFLKRWARFITTLGGRGLFYFYVGSLSLAKWTFLGFIVGIYMMFIGGIYVLYACREDLEQSGKEMIENECKSKGEAEVEKLKAVWAKHDPENDGAIYTKKLGKICKDLGKSLTKSELKAAKAKLDYDGIGEIDFRDFLKWWAEQTEGGTQLPETV
mmetsp:Transcript_26593/g.37051  ORF Transcript_26593/g.37051 Transcript_26593/m.37051 type:complete len:259 (+) Transcript_26593:30-806(+)|eukprot:CAMPEP_0184487942 /NCGR_PEP_ID=MMETSP0113_2-20130426/10429_1 /TAXON_ID=91329 /ORGANISM="Norrisiella sphaerica, Strain BC52" /LENGTH=258 /DNA_ID=CAMNT_0026870383 /DNA_START=35 /DNA_END=811 /DNA_ORIENTATION=-